MCTATGCLQNLCFCLYKFAFFSSLIVSVVRLLTCRQLQEWSRGRHAGLGPRVGACAGSAE